MKIGFDFDGTIINHNDTKVRVCLEKGKKIELWEANSNIFEDTVGEDIYKAISQSIYREETANGNIFPDALEAMRLLRSSGNEMFIVSARHPDSCICAVDWLKSKGFLKVIPEDHMRFCKEPEKPAILDGLGIGLYLDDKLSVLQKLSDNVIKVLFDDQFLVAKGKLSLPEGILAINSWGELDNLIGNLNHS